MNKSLIRLKLMGEDFIRPSEHYNVSLQVIFGLALTQIVDIVSHICTYTLGRGGVQGQGKGAVNGNLSS